MRSFAADLLTHYDRHARVLPWRSPPGTNVAPDPYAVWLSEIMLQQTTVAAVIPYYTAFRTRWPTIADLAAADSGDVMAAWAGLGYYARARNLHACAKAVVADHGGQFPGEEASLRTLPGIGAYTAAAIAAIAFGQRAVVVDANVERVVARVAMIDTPLPTARPAIRAAADTLTPDARAGDFAQAMMDLGAQICRVRAPLCDTCPVRRHCGAAGAGIAETLPIKAPKKAKPERRGTAYWIERQSQDGGREIWLITRPPGGLLGGMRALPDDHWRAQADGDGEPPFPAVWREASASVRHVFTHFALTLSLHQTQWKNDTDPPGDGQWYAVDALKSAGLPTVFARLAAANGAVEEIL